VYPVPAAVAPVISAAVSDVKGSRASARMPTIPKNVKAAAPTMGARRAGGPRAAPMARQARTDTDEQRGFVVRTERLDSESDEGI
jgi:hypothetical protein